ncbi:MAG: neutral/alkaline non-lysosomal ceramidase N-terminal domain-containing protein [Bacteroidota bacterium]|nr:neutral/alkaline non-lysosomal ceramidase N-terminal domain-containing protein [Bacteroidota bacterium]
MNKRFLSIISIVGVLLISITPQLMGEMIETVPLTNLRAGVAKVDITPPIGIPLGGYGIRQGPATGIHDPLYAVVMVFDDGETRAAIVSLDILQVYQQVGDSIRSAIQSATGIHEDHIIINASHTHGSPWIDTDIHYQEEIIAKTAGAARIAVSRLRPISLGYGEGEIDFNISRRTIDADGKCHPKLNPNGICDHRVKILRLDDSDSMIPMAVMMHVVCHSNVFRGENTEVSGDFPGIAKSFIEQAFNNSTTAMFLQGCAGDIRPNLPDLEPGGDGFGRSGSEADMAWCGWTLGTEVVRVATKLRVHEQLIRRKSHFRITAAMATIELDADAEKFSKITIPRDRIIDGKCLLTIRVLKIGDIWFVSLPGEPVVEYGLQIEKNMEGLGELFVMGFSDGDTGYIPVKHMFAEGGYEAECAYTTSCEKVIINGVNRLVKEVLIKSK